MRGSFAALNGVANLVAAGLPGKQDTQRSRYDRPVASGLWQIAGESGDGQRDGAWRQQIPAWQGR
jgi:hypothetical protein